MVNHQEHNIDSIFVKNEIKIILKSLLYFVMLSSRE